MKIKKRMLRWTMGVTFREGKVISFNNIGIIGLKVADE